MLPSNELLRFIKKVDPVTDSTSIGVYNSNGTAYTIFINGVLENDAFSLGQSSYTVLNNLITTLSQNNSWKPMESRPLSAPDFYVGNLYKAGYVQSSGYKIENNHIVENSTTITIYVFTGNVHVIERKLDDTAKLAYLNNFPMNVQEGEFDEICCNLLNIIGTELANSYYKKSVSNNDSVDFSELIDVLASIGEILHDKEFTQPILINQNNTENFASLENEDWNLNDEY